MSINERSNKLIIMNLPEHRVGQRKTIAVWFSCGAASAVAAKKTIEKYGNSHNVIVVNTPIKEEDDDNQRFLQDCENWIGQKIHKATNTRYSESSITEVFTKKQYMSGTRGAVCTGELKKKARYQWETQNDFDFIVLGFTADEKKRHESFIAVEPYPVIPVLIDADITKKDCFNILIKANVELPKIYHKGFHNANCIGCVKASSSGYWNLVRKEYPDVFNERATQSREIGCKLAYYKGERIFLDELPPDAQGYWKDLEMPDCSIFC